MFQNARLKLTAWYLLIIMCVSTLFSVAIFTSSNNELIRFERIQRTRIVFEQQNPNIPRPPMLNPEEIQATRMRLIITLILINTGILGVAAFAGYFLAGRTLHPIQEIMDSQRRFVTDASHELRTPLTILRSEIEVGLRSTKMSIPNAEKLLKSNLEEVISLQKLTDSLLTLSQNGSPLDPSVMQNIHLFDIVTTAVRKTEKLAYTKNIRIENRVKDSVIRGIEDRLIEVFVILIDNAIKYGSENSKVIIFSEKQKNSIIIGIENSGVGIDKKDILYIFDRFYRSEKSRGKIAGYGLGLSIAKKIMKAHGGEIYVESTPGKKTAFFVKFA